MAITGEENSGVAQPTYHGLNLLKRKPEGQTRRLTNTAQETSQITGGIVRKAVSSKNPNFSNPKFSETRQNGNGNGNGNVSQVVNKKTLEQRNSQASVINRNKESKPLKKGSYAEIMARGKAAHAILGQVGRITHKNIEKPPSKREREEMKSLKSQKKLKAVTSNDVLRRADQGKQRSSVTVTPEPPKKIKKAALATTGYTGTARPKINSSSKSSRATSLASTRKDLDDKHRPSRTIRRDSTEDEEDEEEYDEEDQYYESDLSDMEAGALEVDEEEEIAAKIARREDAEALAEENRLKREKEAKRKKLAAMAKSRSERRY